MLYYQTHQNIPDNSHEQIPCLVNFEAPFVKIKTPPKRLHRNLSHNKDYVQYIFHSIPYKEKYPTVTRLPDGTEIYQY